MDAELLEQTPQWAPNLLESAGAQEPLQAAFHQFEELTAEHSAPVHLAGFSIGAMVACHIARHRPDRIARLSLISPAAPLHFGDFLDDMAGKPVFMMAQRTPKYLPMLLRLQGWMSRIAPALLIRQLFAASSASERDLVSAPDEQRILQAALRNSYVAHPQNTSALIRHYVSDWEPVSAPPDYPVDLWHGVEDSWAPLAMSEALAERFGPQAKVKALQGCGHYGALARFSGADVTKG